MKEKIVFIIGSISIILLSSFDVHNSRSLQEGIASEVVRFHVVANSDSKVDQELKLVIKDKITKELEPLLDNVNSIEEARIILADNLTFMENLSNELISSNGFEYSAKASLEYDYFPLKVYGDIALPPGKYEAVRIELGNAKGQNWWCLMFPPLCFVDSTHSVVPDSSKEQLQDVLTEEEYDEILVDEENTNPSDGDINYEKKYKFKLFPALNDFFNLD